MQCISGRVFLLIGIEESGIQKVALETARIYYCFNYLLSYLSTLGIFWKYVTLSGEFLFSLLGKNESLY